MIHRQTAQTKRSSSLSERIFQVQLQPQTPPWCNINSVPSSYSIQIATYTKAHILYIIGNELLFLWRHFISILFIFFASFTICLVRLHQISKRFHQSSHSMIRSHIVRANERNGEIMNVNITISLLLPLYITRICVCQLINSAAINCLIDTNDSLINCHFPPANWWTTNAQATLVRL